MNARAWIVFAIIGAQACSSAATRTAAPASLEALELDDLPPIEWWRSRGPVRRGVGVVYGDGGWPAGIVTVVENRGDEPVECPIDIGVFQVFDLIDPSGNEVPFVGLIPQGGPWLPKIALARDQRAITGFQDVSTRYLFDEPGRYRLAGTSTGAGVIVVPRRVWSRDTIVLARELQRILRGGLIMGRSDLTPVDPDKMRPTGFSLSWDLQHVHEVMIEPAGASPATTDVSRPLGYRRNSSSWTPPPMRFRGVWRGRTVTIRGVELTIAEIRELHRLLR